MKIKAYLHILLTVLITKLAFSQTALNPGEVIITGFNSVGTQQLVFVALTDIEQGTEINFTDREWDGNQFVGNSDNDGDLRYTVENQTLVCGSQIFITNISGDYIPSSGGSISDGGNFNLQSDEVLTIYQGPEDGPDFIFSVDFSSTVHTNATVPDGLTLGVNTVDLVSTSSGMACNGATNGGATFSQAEILIHTATASNWTLNNSSLSLSTCNIACNSCSVETTIWNGFEWNEGSPGTDITAVISGNYNTLTFGNIEACALIVNTGHTLTVSNSRFARIINDVSNHGTLTVETQGNFVQVNDNSQFVDNGISQVSKLTAFKPEWFHYTFWGSPVTNATFGDALPNRPNNRQFEFDSDNYLDVFINEIGNPGVSTTPGHDGIDDNNDAYRVINDNTIMIPGRGYAATENSIGFVPGQFQGNFEGEFNNGVINVSLAYDPANTQVINGQEGAHFNFISNPYASAIDFGALYSENTTVIDGVAYLWSQVSPFDSTNAGNQSENFSQNDYAIINVTGGVAGPSGTIPNDYIPSGQGFFVRSRPGATSTDLIFNNSMRVATEDSNIDFFGIEQHDENILSSANTANILGNEDQKLWITLTSNNGIFNQAMIGYLNGATNTNDGATYDAPRISPGGTTALLYTMIEGEDTQYAIQGKNSASLSETEIITLGFETNIEVETTYTLSLTRLEGFFFENVIIYLEDKLLGVRHNLSESKYDFTSEVGTYNERFELQFVNLLPPPEETFNLPENEDVLIVELDNGDLEFRVSNNVELQSIKIIDLNGRLLYDLDANDNNTYTLSLNTAIYVAQIQLKNGNTITKKLLKQN